MTEDRREAMSAAILARAAQSLPLPLMQRRRNMNALLAATLVALFGVASGQVSAAPLTLGAKYVAMGSSFGAGPGIGKPDAGSGRCGRSTENYAHQFARRHDLRLVDVTCGGATTKEILARWNEVPAQIEAVDGETRLVTVTIGGNDLGYVGLLAAYSCKSATVAQATGGILTKCPAALPPTEGAFTQLEAGLREIAIEVQRRAPAARLIYLQYPAVLPPKGTCAATPISADQADAVRRIATRLATITKAVAHETGAEVLEMANLSRGHDACSGQPWINGFAPATRADGVFYHPTLAGMTAQAEALDQMIWR